jgi:hypothetical protein
MSASTRGSMHGEVGQTQFMPKNILAYGTGNLDVPAGVPARRPKRTPRQHETSS